VKHRTIDEKGIKFSYRDEEYFFPFIGRFQIKNLCTALLVIEILIKKGFTVTKRNMQKGLERCIWRGRFDIVSRSPLILLDGAHNPSAMREMVKSLKEIFPRKKIIAIFSCLTSKDKRGMARQLEKLTDTIILTKIDAERAAEMPELKRAFLKTVSIRDTIKNALSLAREFSDKNSLILITGSIYLVAEAYEALNL